MTEASTTVPTVDTIPAPIPGASPTGDHRPPPPPMPTRTGKSKDYVDAPSSPALHNIVLDYEYTIGNSYRLSFDDNFGVTFHMLNDGSEPRGPLPYLCRALRDGQYLVHWHVREFGIHVALVVDLTDKKISVAAMMPPGSWEFFDQAVDIRISHSK